MNCCCRFPFRLLAAGLIAGGALLVCWSRGEEVDRRVLDAEQQRIAVVEKVKPTVVAIFSPGGQGGGSGVLISKDGLCLTNFHVVEGSGPVMQCGLPDGVFYDAVLVGLDKVGDVALIKLLPKKDGQEFPCAALGDSDKVKAGDWSLAMGNPFLLATDFQPTVTYGLISGVHRYQHPAGILLEYTDCIQIDTSINPGNSGGPLFNTAGELIGINGRGSFEKRGRVNSGVGYAISINQIKNFLPLLKAGIDTDHATLGALVRSDSEEDGGSRLLITSIIENCDANRRGLDVDDELVSFAGQPMRSVNQFKNVLGLYPKGWRVPLVYRRNNEKKEILVRLMQVQPSQSPDEPQNKPKPQPGPPRRRTPPRYSPNSLAAKLYEPKPGFANYYFNKLERDRLLAAFRKQGDFGPVAGDWTFEGQTADPKGTKADALVAIREEAGDRGPDGKPVVREGTYHFKVDTLPDLPPADAKESAFRKAVREGATLLRKHARSFPQEVWAPATNEELKTQVLEMQKDVSAVQARLQEALDELNKLRPEYDKEKVKRWQAHYDYTTARLAMFLAYIQEYNYMLGQLRKDPLPPRDPKVHRGWRMVPEPKLQSGGEAKKLLADADKVWDKMLQDKLLQGTRWEDWVKQARGTQVGLKWIPTGGTKTVVRYTVGGLKYDLDPLKVDQDLSSLKEPRGSGGLLVALYQYRRFLTLGQGGFEGRCDHNGVEPLYPPRPDGTPPKSLNDLRVDCEVLVTEHAAVPVKWYFSRDDATLLGFEVTVDPEDDPCEVYLSDYKMVDGRKLPHRMDVRHGNDPFMTLTIKNYQLASLK